MTYPKGTKFTEWKAYPNPERGKLVWSIRRFVTVPDEKRRPERYPAHKYSEIKPDERKVKDLVIILNGRLPAAQRASERIELNHAYITEQKIDEYVDFVNSQGNDESNGAKARNYVLKYFVDFFISKLGVIDPNKWHKYQSIWGSALLNQLKDIKWNDTIPKPDNVLSVNQLALWDADHTVSYWSVKEIIFNANRFMTFMAKHYPMVMEKFLAFEPISNAKLSALKANTEKPSEKRKWFIPDRDWEIIKTHIKGHRIEGAINLIYAFGLRRKEGLGLVPSDIKKHGLLIERQLLKFDETDQPITKPPKKGKFRSVEYWSMSIEQDYAQKQTLKFIRQQLEAKVTPNYISKQWAKLMSELKMPYHLHDLRRTWITKAFRDATRAPDRIRINAGHSELSTTMGYNLNESILEDDTWVPTDNEL